MKKVICSLLWLFMATTALLAQPLPINHPDSSRFFAEAVAVVQNAPLIFKATKMRSRVVRSDKDEVIFIQQLRVHEVIKGNIKENDIVEVSYSLGWAQWDEKGNFTFPLHSYHPDVHWGNVSMPIYYFCKPLTTKPYLENSTRCFSLYSESPFSVATFDADENINPEWISIIYFNGGIRFHKEANFLNFLNKALTPQPIKVIKTIRKSKNKHKRSVGTIEGDRYQLMPQKVFNIYVLDSTSNLTFRLQNGWYGMIMQTNSPTANSFLRELQIDVTYDNFYFYPNACLDTSKIKISPWGYFAGNGYNCQGGFKPSYTTTVTPLTANKFRLKITLINYSALGCSSIYRLSIPTAYTQLYDIRFKLVNPAITCMPSVGSISNVIAKYDDVPNDNSPWITTPTNFLVQYDNNNTKFRTTNQIPNACTQAIDSIVFSPRTIRAGTDEVLTLTAYAGNPPSAVPWFGNSRGANGNIQFRDANFANDNLNNPNYVRKIDNADIVSWTDLAVKVKIPSLYFDSLSTKGCAGSGQIIVTNNQNDTKISPTKLHIEYAAINRRSTIDTTKKVRYLLVNQGCRNQYKLRCNAGMPIEQQRATFAAARAWNRKLGYAVFQINETPVTYNWKADECIVRYVDTISPAAIMDTRQKNQTGTNANNYFINDGFDIRVMKKYVMNDGVVLTNVWQTDTAAWVINGTDTTFQWTAPMDTINYTQVPKVGGGYWYNYKLDFYVSMLHEMGHGLGLNHNIDAYHTNAYNDFEIMYYATSTSGNTPMRQTLTAHGGETLKGARRILNDSKNIVWNISSYGTFTKPVAALTLTKVPANRNICGYGATKNAKATLSTLPTIAITGASYNWAYASSTGYISNGTTFTGQGTNTLTVKNNDPSILNNINVNGIAVLCNSYLNSCQVSSDTFLFKAAANVVLQPTPSRCLNGSLQWVLPKPVPVGGTFTAYNMTNPNTAITNVVDSLYIMDRTKFAAASTYKMVYKTNNTATGVCPITKDSTYMTTFTNCNTLSNTVHKICINEVSRDQTAYRNGGTNDPCNGMAFYFTALGSFNAGDKLIVKLSDATGAIDTLAVNIAQRAVGIYTFANAVNASISGTNDSIKLTNIKPLITTASTNYRMRIFLKRVGTTTLIEWGDSSPEPISFIVSTLCSTTDPPCNGCGSRLAALLPTTTNIRIYPNPANNQFIVALPPSESPTNIIITDIQGRVIEIHQTTNTLHEINTANYAAGMYFVKVQQGNIHETLKLVVLH
jgi:hypothetical protein